MHQDTQPGGTLIAFPHSTTSTSVTRLHLARLLPLQAPEPSVQPRREPWVELITTDPAQRISRIADNKFQIDGATLNSAILQSSADLTVDGQSGRVFLNRGEGALKTGHRIAEAVPLGYRAEVSPALALGSVILSIHHDDESRREPAAA